MLGGVLFLLPHSVFFGFFCRIRSAALLPLLRSAPLRSFAVCRLPFAVFIASLRSAPLMRFTLNIERLMLHVARCTCAFYHV